MQLGCSDINQLFIPEQEQINKYYSDDYSIYETRSLNNLYTFCGQIAEGTSVLDVGCAQGKIGEALKNKNCKVYGMDLDEVAAGIAMKTGYYVDVAVCNIMDKSSPEMERLLKQENNFDVIIFSDLLEHLPDPTEVLIRFSHFLKTGGKILVSVPNIAHADIVLHLLNGQFNYSRMGILDNTHMKFFTKDSFPQWIEQVNLYNTEFNFDCSFLGTTFYNNDYLEAIKEHYRELYNILQCNENYLGLTILFELTKCPAGTETPSLDALLQEKSKDIVDKLGQALKGKLPAVDNQEVAGGERLWYETQLETLRKSDAELRKTRDYIVELENRLGISDNELQKSRNYIAELEGKLGISDEELQNSRSYIAELEEKLNISGEELQRSRSYITELESNAETCGIELEKTKSHITELKGRLHSAKLLIDARDDYITRLEKDCKENAEANMGI